MWEDNEHHQEHPHVHHGGFRQRQRDCIE